MRATVNLTMERRARAPFDEEGLFVRFNQQAEPAARLFCFPYAGGDANIFRSWVKDLPSTVEIIGVQYPGRSSQDGSAAISRCELVVELLHRAIVPLLDRDFVFFGHSNGALISFELARALAPERRKFHRHHVFSARLPAHMPRARKSISALPYAEFICELRSMGGTPPELLADERLMRMLVPRLRADFAIGENYVFKPGALLECDITTLHGATDHLVNGAHVPLWAELTTGIAQHRVIDGDHFFINSRRQDALAILHPLLRAVVSRRPGIS